MKRTRSDDINGDEAKKEARTTTPDTSSPPPPPPPTTIRDPSTSPPSLSQEEAKADLMLQCAHPAVFLQTGAGRELHIAQHDMEKAMDVVASCSSRAPTAVYLHACGGKKIRIPSANLERAQSTLQRLASRDTARAAFVGLPTPKKAKKAEGDICFARFGFIDGPAHDLVDEEERENESAVGAFLTTAAGVPMKTPTPSEAKRANRILAKDKKAPVVSLSQGSDMSYVRLGISPYDAEEEEESEEEEWDVKPEGAGFMKASGVTQGDVNDAKKEKRAKAQLLVSHCSQGSDACLLEFEKEEKSIEGEADACFVRLGIAKESCPLAGDRDAPREMSEHNEEVSKPKPTAQCYLNMGITQEEGA